MMKRMISAISAVLIAGLVLFGCSKGYERQTAAGDLKITVSADRYPLVKGENNITVKVADASGKPVSGALVNVHYFMPPMPGMAPMDFNTQAMQKGDTYTASANIPMEGGWKVETSVSQPGKPVASATFNMDAR